MSTIKSSTTTTTAYSVTADTTGTLVIQTGSTPTTAVTVGTDQSVTFAQAANLPNTFGFKNRIINGAMVIDARNAGAVVTVSANPQYMVDRWQTWNSPAGKFTFQQTPSTTETGFATRVSAGFTNYLAITSNSAYSISASDYFAIEQCIEGNNVSDLAFGTANAKTVTISFWVRSSLTGTFGGYIKNSAADRSYVFSYSISSANTWEQKTVTIAGDQSGTWLTTNGIGFRLGFSFGIGSSGATTAGAWTAGNYSSVSAQTSVVGTNGATFYITGVQLEKGLTATSFDYRPYGTELALCQRYYQQYSHAPLRGVASSSTTLGRGGMVLPVVMRSAPSVTITTAINWYDGAGAGNITSITTNYSTTTSCEFDSTLATGTTAQFRPLVIYNSSSGALNLSSEL